MEKEPPQNEPGCDKAKTPDGQEELDTTDSSGDLHHEVELQIETLSREAAERKFERVEHWSKGFGFRFIGIEELTSVVRQKQIYPENGGSSHWRKGEIRYISVPAEHRNKCREAELDRDYSSIVNFFDRIRVSFNHPQLKDKDQAIDDFDTGSTILEFLQEHRVSGLSFDDWNEMIRRCSGYEFISSEMQGELGEINPINNYLLNSASWPERFTHTGNNLNNVSTLMPEHFVRTRLINSLKKAERDGGSFAQKRVIFRDEILADPFFEQLSQIFEFDTERSNSQKNGEFSATEQSPSNLVRSILNDVNKIETLKRFLTDPARDKTPLREIFEILTYIKPYSLPGSYSLGIITSSRPIRGGRTSDASGYNGYIPGLVNIDSKEHPEEDLLAIVDLTGDRQHLARVVDLLETAGEWSAPLFDVNGYIRYPRSIKPVENVFTTLFSDEKFRVYLRYLSERYPDLVRSCDETESE